MPEPRASRGRDFSASAPIQFDSSERTRELENLYQRKRRSDALPGNRTIRAMRGAVPVEVRNGIPWKPYVYRGLGYDQMEAAIDADDLAWCKENGWARDA